MALGDAGERGHLMASQKVKTHRLRISGGGSFHRKDLILTQKSTLTNVKKGGITQYLLIGQSKSHEKSRTDRTFQNSKVLGNYWRHICMTHEINLKQNVKLNLKFARSK